MQPHAQTSSPEAKPDNPFLVLNREMVDAANHLGDVVGLLTVLDAMWSHPEADEYEEEVHTLARVTIRIAQEARGHIQGAVEISEREARHG